MSLGVIDRRFGLSLSRDLVEDAQLPTAAVSRRPDLDGLQLPEPMGRQREACSPASQPSAGPPARYEISRLPSPNREIIDI
jgi:hypothetical protein